MVRIAFQGAPGAYSELAARTLFPRARGVPVGDFAGVVRMVLAGKTELGILPVRNTIVGPVRDAAMAIESAPGLVIVNEVSLPIRHCLLALPGATLRSIRWVESHPVALAQCGAWLTAQGLVGRAVADTAGAARTIAADRDYHRAAIAGREAAEQYGLDVLAEGIADVADNETHFVVVSASAAVGVAA